MKTDNIVTPLKELLRPVVRQESVEADQTYNILGAHWYADGLYTKEIKSGAGIQADKVYRVEEGDFVYNRLFAWKGSFAIASSENHNCYVSNEFPIFKINLDKIDPTYLWRYFSRQTAWSEGLGLSSGGTPTSRNRLKEEKLLAMEIPLPSIEEQRRIVARIEELATKIEEAQGLRREAMEEADKLVEELEFQLWPDEDVKNNSCSLEEVTVFLSRGRHSEQGYSDHYLIKTQHVQLGKYIKSQFTLDSEIAERVQPEATVKKGDILIACSAAGCLGRVAQFMEDQLATTDTHVAIARANTRVILPEYLYAYLKGAQGQIQLRSRERGDWTREKVGFRLTELNLADLKRVPVPVPSIQEQRNLLERLENLQSKLNIIKGDQSVTSAELNALLPSILDKAFKGEL